MVTGLEIAAILASQQNDERSSDLTFQQNQQQIYKRNSVKYTTM
jgi:hypothetical protein